MIEDEEYRYSVAWIDSVHPSGRGVLTRGDHAPADWLPAKEHADSLAYRPTALGRVPPIFPSGLVNPLTMRAFNEAWFRKAPKSKQGELQSITTFFHPLDVALEWNRGYGSRGFLQYQFAVPDAAGHLVRDDARALGPSVRFVPLTVLKRFGLRPTLPVVPQRVDACDRRAGGVDGLAATLDALDGRCWPRAAALFLAKDSRMSPGMMAASYPRLSEWQRVRDAMDPRGLHLRPGKELSL